WLARMPMNLRHQSLIAWQRADDLFIRLHQVATRSFPDIERYELSSQLRRAAYSVAANIVEGFARRYRRARLHFLNISESSLAEVGYCGHAGSTWGYLTEDERKDLEKDLNRVGAPLRGLVRSTKSMSAVID